MKQKRKRFLSRANQTSIRVLSLCSTLLLSSLQAQIHVGNVTLETQTAVSNFSFTQVEGRLQIRDNGSDPITNLDGLSSVHSVLYDLDIINNASLTNIDGLNSVTSVGGFLSISDNPSLTNIDGFNALTSVGFSIGIRRNASLINIDGLNSLSSVGRSINMSINPSLTNIGGFGSLSSVGGGVLVNNNDSLQEFCGFYPLLSSGSIGGIFFAFENLINPTVQDILDAGPCFVDSDGDGVPDAIDLYPNSDLRGTLWVGDCDSGVSNDIDGFLTDELGCSLADLLTEALTEAASGVRNHGQFVASMADCLNGWVDLGLLTPEEHEAVMSCVGARD